MKGRLEHTLETQSKIEEMLKTLPEVVRGYYYSIQLRKEAKTCWTYIWHVSRYLDSINNDLERIDDDSVSRFLVEHRTKLNAKGEVVNTSFSYQKLIWSSLNSFFMYLRKKRIIAENPCDLVERPNNEDNPQRVALDSRQLRLLMKAVSDGAGSYESKVRQLQWKKRDSLILAMLIDTGMRRTALTEINVDDIDFENRKINITDKRMTYLTYDIPDSLMNRIEEWLEDRAEKLEEYGRTSDALFISNQGDRISDKSVDRLVRKYSYAAFGVEISPHKLRASFVTNYYKASGHDINATCKAVGHKSITTTARYIVDENKSRTNAVNYMDNIICDL